MHKMKPAKILISACLLGENVRYNQKPLIFHSPILEHWQKLDLLVPFCPEVEGGLEIPRPPAEIQPVSHQQNSLSVRDIQGKEVSTYFQSGATKAWLCCREQGIQMAILKERSPSCGVHRIYDGHFSNQIISGMGITTELLRKRGIEVFSEDELETAYEYWCSFSSGIAGREAIVSLARH